MIIYLLIDLHVGRQAGEVDGPHLGHASHVHFRAVLVPYVRVL